MNEKLEKLADEFLALVLEGHSGEIERFIALHPELDEAERQRMRNLASAIASPGPPAPTKELADAGGAGIRAESTPARMPLEDSASPANVLEKLRGEPPRGARYKPLGEVARGGMGAILKVWDGELRRTLAMKVALGDGQGRPAPTDARSLARFFEEAQITGQLEHPGIVPVHELGLASDGRVYFTMRLVKGRDLRAVFEDVRAEKDGWSLTRALGVMHKICEAMSYAHSKGVIHRDLKPSNVMVGAFGEVYVMDWGLARVLGRERGRAAEPLPDPIVTTERHERREEKPDSPILTHAGDVVGTPSYMPPEQARGELDRLGPRSDVYSMGAMLYELIGGRMPFVEQSMSDTHQTVLERLRNGPPKPLEQLAPRTPAELIAICERAMQREIAARYATMTELGDDLRAFLEGRVVRAYQTGTWAETKKWVQRNNALATAMAGAVVIAITGAVAFYFQARRANASALDAREKAYVSNMMATEASLQANESAEARRRLGDCDSVRHANWEWRHFQLAAETSLESWKNLGQYVRAVAFAPDDSKVYAGMQGGSGKVWDLKAKTCTTILSTNLDLYATAVSPDGRWVAFGGHKGYLALLDASNGYSARLLAGHERGLLSLDFSDDGRWLVSGADDSTARVYDVESGASVAVLRGHSGFVGSVAFSPDGRLVASASADRTIRLWDWRAEHETCVLIGHALEVRSVAFSPDGSRLVSGGDDATVRTWDASTGDPLLRMLGHTDGVRSVAFNANGTLIASASTDRSVKVWDAGTGGLLSTHRGHDMGVQSVVFAHASDRLASGSKDGSLRIWSALTNDATVLTGHDESVGSLAFDAEGTRLATAGADCMVRVWDPRLGSLETLRRSRELSGNATVIGCDRAAVFAVTRNCRELDVWRLDRSQPSELAFALPPVTKMARRSPDGRLLALVRQDDSVEVRPCPGASNGWTDPSSGDPLLRIEFGKNVSALEFGAGSRWLALSGVDQLEVWDVPRRERAFAPDSERGCSTALAFDPEGGRLLRGAAGSEVELWDLRRGQLLSELRGHTAQVGCAAFSPDGERIATGAKDSTIRIWDARTYETVAVLRGHQDEVLAVGFDRSGDRLASTSTDRTVRIWQTSPIRERAQAQEAQAALQQAAAAKLEELFSEFDSAARVIAELERRKDLAPAVAEACASLALAEGDDPRWLTESVWQVVRARGGTLEAYRRALRRAERAHRLSPGDPRALFARGAARYRVGEYEGALADLTRSAAEAPDEPDRMPFLAMAHFKLGHVEVARGILECAVEFMQSYQRALKSQADYHEKHWEDDPDLQSLLIEAGQVLGDARAK